MDKRKNRNLAALGALVIVASGIFVWGMYYLLGTPMLRGGMNVVVTLEDGAGLRRGDRVQLQGVDVGSVRSVTLAPPRVYVNLRLRDGLILPEDTRAAVSGDVFGAHTIQLVPGSAFVRLEHGDTIAGMAARGLTDIAAGIADRAQVLLGRADTMLSVQAAADLQATAAVLPAGARELLAAFSELRLAAASMRRSAEGVEGVRAGDALVSALNEFETSARALTSAVGSMDRSLGAFASVAEKIDQGQGTLGQLVNDPSLYNNFNDALREVGIMAGEVSMLAGDIRERPRRYIEFRIF
jgi:phospholipid/cholesterol/gamma-HCH transport system substrate-binding protein